MPDSSPPSTWALLPPFWEEFTCLDESEDPLVDPEASGVFLLPLAQQKTA